jgi:hypothetical protein
MSKSLFSTETPAKLSPNLAAPAPAEASAPHDAAWNGYSWPHAKGPSLEVDPADDPRKANYGFGPVPKLPTGDPRSAEQIAAQESGPTYALAGGGEKRVPSVAQQQREVMIDSCEGNAARQRAAELSGETNRTRGKAVLIKMPNLHKPILLGGEGLVSALANGGVPVE